MLDIMIIRFIISLAMIDIIIACIVGWFAALVSSLAIWGIIELSKGIVKLIEKIYYMLVNNLDCLRAYRH